MAKLDMVGNAVHNGIQVFEKAGGFTEDFVNHMHRQLQNIWIGDLIKLAQPIVDDVKQVFLFFLQE